MSRLGVMGVAVTAIILVSIYAWTRETSSGSVVSRPEVETPAAPRVTLGARATVRHEIGKVARGSRSEVPFVVANTGSETLIVGPIRTSCDCFRIELDAKQVPAGTEVGGRAIIDLAGEPAFAGGLILTAEASEDGRPVFALQLSVEVK
jgi:hypothetical protein